MLESSIGVLALVAFGLTLYVIFKAAYRSLPGIYAVMLFCVILGVGSLVWGVMAQDVRRAVFGVFMLLDAVMTWIRRNQFVHGTNDPVRAFLERHRSCQSTHALARGGQMKGSCKTFFIC